MEGYDDGVGRYMRGIGVRESMKPGTYDGEECTRKELDDRIESGVLVFTSIEGKVEHEEVCSGMEVEVRC